MATRDEMTGLEAGAMLAALPLDEMIASLGVGIAKAQDKLDANTLETAIKLAETKLEFPGPLDSDGNPTTLSRSLLSLGFTPTFYHFTEASLELKIEMKISVESNKSLAATGTAKVEKGPVAIAGSVSYSDAKKYSADSSAMTHVSVRMVSSPPPAEFLEFIRKVDGLQPTSSSQPAAALPANTDTSTPPSAPPAAETPPAETPPAETPPAETPPADSGGTGGT